MLSVLEESNFAKVLQCRPGELERPERVLFKQSASAGF